MDLAATARICGARDQQPSEDEIRAKLATPNEERVWYLRYAMKAGMSLEEIHELTAIDPWFLDQLSRNRRDGGSVCGRLRALDGRRYAARCGRPSSSDSPIASWRPSSTRTRWKSAIIARSAASWRHSSRSTPARRSSRPTRRTTIRRTKTKTKRRPRHPGKKRIMILGGGPNRIGQGIEFDYCCCHASFALRELGIESIMVNSNPETVSTDYDTSDLLFFEPLDDRRRAEHLRSRAAGRRDRAVWRADAAESGPRTGHGRRADHWDQRRYDRSGRGSREVPAAAGHG